LAPRGLPMHLHAFSDAIGTMDAEWDNQGLPGDGRTCDRAQGVVLWRGGVR